MQWVERLAKCTVDFVYKPGHVFSPPHILSHMLALGAFLTITDNNAMHSAVLKA